MNYPTVFGLSVLILLIVWAVRFRIADRRKTQERIAEVRRLANERHKASMAKKAWDHVEYPRVEKPKPLPKPTTLATVRKQALTVPNTPKLKPSYMSPPIAPEPKREEGRSSSRDSDDVLGNMVVGYLAGKAVESLFSGSSNETTTTKPFESGGGGEYAGGGASGSWGGSDDSSSSSCDSSSSWSSSDDN